MNVLITGGAGFIGGFLAAHCLELGHSVFGMGLGEPGPIWKRCPFEHCDVRDVPRFTDILAGFRPDVVFHLAAQSYPTVSLVQPAETMEVNAGGTINLYEATRVIGIKPMIVVACSSAEYGPVSSRDLPVREEHPLRPLHPYGVSKVAQDLLAAQYFTNYGIPSVRIRIFNTTGPGKLGDVCSDLARRAIEIERGLRQPLLPVGNLSTRRALMDVRDLVRGLWLSVERCEPGEVYNIGGNQICSVEELIGMIRGHVSRPFQVEQEQSLVRACDEPVIAGDVSKFQARSQWRPEIRIEKTVEDILAWWRAELETASALPPALTNVGGGVY